MGKGVTVTTGFVSGETTPAWTTQRFALQPLSHLPVIYLESSLDYHLRSGGTLLYSQQIAILLKRRHSTWTPSSQVRCEMIRYFCLLSSVVRPHFPLICNLFSNRCEG